MTEQRDISGIGGWLILIAIGVVISPIRLTYIIATTYPDIFTSGTWEMLTTEGSDAYHPLWLPLLSGEILINGALLVASLYMAYLFFTRKRSFPDWFIGIAVFSLLFIIADAFAILAILPDETVFDPDTSAEALRAAILVVIWVPYMRVSKRVKATFVAAGNKSNET